MWEERSGGKTWGGGAVGATLPRPACGCGEKGCVYGKHAASRQGLGAKQSNLVGFRRGGEREGKARHAE